MDLCVLEASKNSCQYASVEKCQIMAHVQSVILSNKLQLQMWLHTLLQLQVWSYFKLGLKLGEGG